MSRIKRYNIGAGSFRHKGWINVDHPSTWYAEVQENNIDIAWDLLALTPLPVDTESADLIYSSFCIEHVTDAAVVHMLREAHRILKPGGIIRLQAPDVDAFYAYFVRGLRIPWADVKVPGTSQVPLREASLPQTFLWTFAANATEIHVNGAKVRLSDDEIIAAFVDWPYHMALNCCQSFVSLEKQKLYPGNHMNWWNTNKALDTLHWAGFNHAYPSASGESQAEDMQDTEVFDSMHKKTSLYVEAYK